MGLSEGSTGRQATVGWCSREHNVQRRTIPSQTIACMCVIYKDSENLPFIYTMLLRKYLSYFPWLPSLSFQPHSPHSRFHPPFLKGEYQEVRWMPGVGSMPIPKSGIQPRLIRGRTKQKSFPGNWLTGFVTRKDQEGQRLQCQKKKSNTVRAKLSFRRAKKPGFPGNRSRVARLLLYSLNSCSVANNSEEP